MSGLLEHKRPEQNGENMEAENKMLRRITEDIMSNTA